MSMRGETEPQTKRKIVLQFEPDQTSKMGLLDAKEGMLEVKEIRVEMIDSPNTNQSKMIEQLRNTPENFEGQAQHFAINVKPLVSPTKFNIEDSA